MNSRLKMYVLCRKDLGAIYGIVQGTHAVAEYLLKKETKWMNGTIVMLGVTNEYVLKKWQEKLQKNNIPFASFLEPDLGQQLTAIACVLEDGKIFEKLRLFS